MTIELAVIYASQLFGFISTGFFLYSDIQEDDEKLDKFYTIGNVFFLVHLLLLKSFIPAVTVFLAVIRNSLNNIYKDNTYLRYAFVFIFFSIFIAAITLFDEWQLALPASVSLIMTFAFLYTKGNLLTFLIGLCSVLWLIVGIHISSYSIIALEVVSLVLLGYRYYKQNISKPKLSMQN